MDIMSIIDDDDKKLLENGRIINMSRIDWGKTISISNQYIQRNILRHMLNIYVIKYIQQMILKYLLLRIIHLVMT
jgi:hypothetical protein